MLVHRLLTLVSGLVLWLQQPKLYNKSPWPRLVQALCHALPAASPVKLPEQLACLR